MLLNIQDILGVFSKAAKKPDAFIGVELTSEHRVCARFSQGRSTRLIERDELVRDFYHRDDFGTIDTLLAAQNYETLKGLVLSGQRVSPVARDGYLVTLSNVELEEAPWLGTKRTQVHLSETEIAKGLPEITAAVKNKYPHFFPDYIPPVDACNGFPSSENNAYRSVMSNLHLLESLAAGAKGSVCCTPFAGESAFRLK